MVQSLGFTSDEKPTCICQLLKYIYVLKQSPWAWYNNLTRYLSSIVFFKMLYDASLLSKHSEGDTLFILSYVDDINISGSNNLSVNQVITSLASKFSIKDLCNLHYFLGAEMIRSSIGLILTKVNYVNEILYDELMTNCKSVSMSMSAYDLFTLCDGTYLTNIVCYC